MKQLPNNYYPIASAVCIAFFALSASAQALWKYTDKDGKVTYSDKAPTDGAKAERVNADTTGTVIPASKNVIGGTTQSSATISNRASTREATRDLFRKQVDDARDALDAAKKALETGREAKEEERQIVVGRGQNGQPTGVNAVLRKPEYEQRIAALEEAIKKAEENVAAAEKNMRNDAPR